MIRNPHVSHRTHTVMESSKNPIWTLKYERAFLTSQVITTTKMWRVHILLLPLFCCIVVRDGTAICQSKYTSTFKIIAPGKDAWDCIISVDLKLYTLITNHNLSEYIFVKKSIISSFVRKELHRKKLPHSRNDVSHQFLAFWVKSYS